MATPDGKNKTGMLSPAKPASPAALAKAAHEAYRNRRHAAAAAYFRLLEQARPDFDDWSLNDVLAYAGALRRSGEFATAIALLRRNESRKLPRSSKSVVQAAVAELLFKQGRYRAARTAFTALLKSGLAGMPELRFQCELGIARADLMSGDAEAALFRLLDLPAAVKPYTVLQRAGFALVFGRAAFALGAIGEAKRSLSNAKAALATAAHSDERADLTLLVTELEVSTAVIEGRSEDTIAAAYELLECTKDLPKTDVRRIAAVTLYAETASRIKPVYTLQLIDDLLDDSENVPHDWHARLIAVRLAILLEIERAEEAVALPKVVLQRIDRHTDPLSRIRIHTLLAEAAIAVGDHAERAFAEFRNVLQARQDFGLAHGQAMAALSKRRLTERQRSILFAGQLERMHQVEQAMDEVRRCWDRATASLMRRMVEGERDRELMLQTFSHDLGNLFHGIQFIPDAADITDRDIAQLRDLAKKGAGYIRFIRNFLQMTARSFNETVNIEEIVEEAIKGAELFALTGGVKLQQNTTPIIIRKVDSRILQEALLGNLIYNAIKFTPTGKTVTVNARHQNGKVVIEVVDQGRGMSKAIQEKVMLEKTVPSTPGERGEIGSGIGLMIVKRLTERMGGKFSIVSPYNESGGCAVRLEWKT